MHKNTDESCVGPYTLPDVLKCSDGRMIDNAFDWVNTRRSEILDIYRRTMYGFLPPRPDKTEFEVISEKNDALDNTAIRKEIRLSFAMNNGRKHSFVMLLYIPKNAAKPVPVFCGLNFKGNHNCTFEDDVEMTGRNSSGELVETERSDQIHRWQFAETVKRGFASATVCYHDIYPDEKDENSWRKSVYNMFFADESNEEFHSHASAVSAWAWGLSRMLDCLESEPLIDSSKAFVHGHSRLGKTSLWAGANDTRFKMVVSNDSGCCGSALLRRDFGETVEIITHYFPHWFVSSFAGYACCEAEIPFDQHWLISLIAPRYAAIGSAEEDLHADPKGEFLSGAHAGRVYNLFGIETYNENTPHPVNSCITGAVSYHIRSGGHDQTLVDWKHYWEIADIIKG
ncbi:MAG: acetylxylan esterase [Lentisphaeria bacterium]|nr:acetylxylan esterase [Lentisphaeria bacterium]